jgi:hypothetical protein
MDASFHAGEQQEDEVTAFTIKVRHFARPFATLSSALKQAATDKGVDYMKLIERFGSEHITPELVARLVRDHMRCWFV